MNTRQTAYAMLGGLGHCLLASLAVGLMVSLLLILLVLLLTPQARAMSAREAAVDQMQMQVGARVIGGVIPERLAARRAARFVGVAGVVS